jgi:hypothetical protein
VEIRGRAKWETFINQNKNSYGLFNKYGRLVRVEFVNDSDWYEIEWLNNHKQYFTNGDLKINLSSYQLGTWDRPYRSEVHLPLAQEEVASSSKGKERAGSLTPKTPARELSPAESLLEQEIKGEPPQRAPTATMAETVTIATAHTDISPVFMQTDQGTAGQPAPHSSSASRQPSQVAPNTQKSRGRGDPPGGGGNPPGGGGGGDNPGGHPNWADLPDEPPNSPGEGGRLEGDPPQRYDGDRTKTRQFVKEFQLWWRLNRRHKKMKLPADRVALALTYIKGPKVNNWVYRQIELLSKRVDGDGRHSPDYHESEEELWTNFVDDFIKAFIHTAGKEEAFSQLRALNMVGLEVDEYVAEFELLVLEAGWKLDDEGTMELFKDGLPQWLTKRMLLMREHRPDTLKGWIQSVQEEIAREVELRTTLGSRRGSGREATRLARQGGQPTKKRDPNAMDVDVNLVRTSPLSPEERARLLKERKCFNCKKEGHQARNCPSKRKPSPGERKKKKSSSKARTAQIEEIDDREEEEESKEPVEETPPAYDSLVRQVRALKNKEREALLDDLASQDFA